MGVVLVRVGSKSVVFRKGAPCPLVASNTGPSLPFPGFSPGALCHGWLIPLVGFVPERCRGSVGDGSSNPRLSSAPAGVMARFGGF